MSTGCNDTNPNSLEDEESSKTNETISTLLQRLLDFEDSLNRWADWKASKQKPHIPKRHFPNEKTDTNESHYYKNTTLQKGTFECSICLNVCCIEDRITLKCKHSFCGKCVIEYVKHVRNSSIGPVSLKCALCREEYIQITCTKVDHYRVLRELV
jgi:hypothetical protein